MTNNLPPREGGSREPEVINLQSTPERGESASESEVRPIPEAVQMTPPVTVEGAPNIADVQPVSPPEAGWADQPAPDEPPLLTPSLLDTASLREIEAAVASDADNQETQAP